MSNYDEHKGLRLIVSGGGTGGHIYPALAIADYVRDHIPAAEILFVGAKGRMEETKVPENGYDIETLNIRGIDRSKPLNNLTLPFVVLGSFAKASKIIRRFRPNAVVGVGGYASFPVAFMSAIWGKPVLLQEQNSFPGIANLQSARHAKAVCTAYDEALKFFPKRMRKVVTGNPVRSKLRLTDNTAQEGYAHFGFADNKPVLMVTGGSLGARTLNESMKACIDSLVAEGIQVLWQTGKLYYDDITAEYGNKHGAQVKIVPFINRMDYAYSIADLVVARAGAMTLTELANLGKACILVPSPNVAEDHQTKNAKAYVDKRAAIMVRDDEAVERLGTEITDCFRNEQQLNIMAHNIRQFARPDATHQIVEEILRIAR